MHPDYVHQLSHRTPHQRNHSASEPIFTFNLNSLFLILYSLAGQLLGIVQSVDAIVKLFTALLFDLEVHMQLFRIVPSRILTHTKLEMETSAEEKP
jgi:hypothetical protein